MSVSGQQSLRKNWFRFASIIAKRLFDDVVPWWQQHSLDREHGGYFSCLERDGRPWSTDKFMWMTGREIWMFSHLYNRCRQDPAWLDVARLGRLPCQTRLPARGQNVLPARGRRPAAGQGAEHLHRGLRGDRLGRVEPGRRRRDALDAGDGDVRFPGAPLRPAVDTPLLGYPIEAQFHLHAHDMCRITVAAVFNEIRPDPRFEADLMLSAESIVKKHWKPKSVGAAGDAAPDGAVMLDLPEGRMFHPGHAIESAWMLTGDRPKTRRPEILPAPRSRSCWRPWNKVGTRSTAA